MSWDIILVRAEDNIKDLNELTEENVKDFPNETARKISEICV